MKNFSRIVALLGFCIIACQPVPHEYTTLKGNAQGTTFHITYKDSLQRDFSSEVDSLFRLIDGSMSLWDTNSVITKINRNDTSVLLDEHFSNVFERAREISEITGGAFDVTVGPLVKAWGFSIKHNSHVPDSAMVDSLRNLTDYTRIKIRDLRMLKEDSRIQLDFNAIAQGYTVDLLSGFLRSKGVQHFLVEIGGEVRALGLNERNADWQIGIDKPVDSITDNRPLQTTISLKNKALATSGSYRKFILKDGQKLSHIINPATGYPVYQNLLSVSVLADDCTTADAFATAFMVLGIDQSMAMAKENNLEIYCIYAGASGKLEVVATPGFLK